MSQAEIDRTLLDAAYQQAVKSLREGGIPIGAALATGDGTILALGHNLRVQASEQIAHAEMVCLRNAGVGRGDWGELIMATTLSPCAMCSGAAILHGLRRVVVGESVNFKGREDWLIEAGIETRVLDDDRCKRMMAAWIEANPELWRDDVPTLPGARSPRKRVVQVKGGNAKGARDARDARGVAKRK